MSLSSELIDRLYLKYGYRQVAKGNNVKLFLYEKGRYYGADIIPMDETSETNELCNKIKKEYGDGGYAAQIKKYSCVQDVSIELYRSFFSYDSTKRRITSNYLNFVENQSRLNGGTKYEYLHSPFRINNELDGQNNLINQIVERFTSDRPQFIIIEAAAGYGKTCTAFELLKKTLDCPYCGNPLMTVLSRNRGANIFRYILLDEIDREYPFLDSSLVTYEIQNGTIPLIIDGFDELLNKSEIIKNEKDKVFGEVETMLDTIGSLLKNKARIVLTSRKTAIFIGEEFQNWLEKWNNSFDVTRYSIEIPKIKDWLSPNKVELIKQSEIPVEYIANPVLLTYLRNLSLNDFENHINEPDTIIRKYFRSLLEREMVRQELKINPDDQYLIFKNTVRLLIEMDQSTADRSFFREIILEENKTIIENAIKLYPADKNVEWLADKLITHALLDRKGNIENNIGFINDFVFGTFIGEIMSETDTEGVEKLFSSYMVELGATAYRVQNAQNKTALWNKIGQLDNKFENNTLFTFDITLKGRLERNYESTIFQSIQIFKISFSSEFSIRSSVFISCTFKKCIFSQNAFDSVSFIDCTFDDCKLEDMNYLNEFNNSFFIKCKQIKCNVLSLNVVDDLRKDENLELENKILKEIYSLEKKVKGQRIIYLMKRFSKAEHRNVVALMEKMEKEKLIRMVGSDTFIEINKIQEVKKRIGEL